MTLATLARSVILGRHFNLLKSCTFHSGSPSRGFDEDSLKKAKPYENIPKVPMFPLIGSAWAYMPYIGKYSVDKMHSADINKHLTYGDMVREKFGRFEIVNCYNPEAMYVIMEEDKSDAHPSRGTFATLKTYRYMRRDWYKTTGLLLTEGIEWDYLRDTIGRCIFDPGFLKRYIEPMNEIATDLKELIRNDRGKGEMDIMPYLNKWSFEAMSFITLGKRLECLVPNLHSTSVAMAMIKSIEIQLECMNKLEASAGNISLWKYLPTPTWRKFVQAADTFTSLAFQNLVNSAIETEYDADEGRPSLLHQLIQSLGLTNSMVLMIDFMMAGVDTTSNTAGFLLYELAKNPQKQETAFKEINALLPKKGDMLTFEKYKDLKYLRNCLKESMRLHPVARGNIRMFKKDVVICGYRIPAGTAVLCVLQVVYRNPRYFHLPNKFNPERWEEEKRYPFFQPFGYGKRNCLGSNLAELEVLTMAAEVLRNFRLEYHYEDIDMTTKLINTPDRPIRLHLLDR